MSGDHEDDADDDDDGDADDDEEDDLMIMITVMMMRMLRMRMRRRGTMMMWRRRTNSKTRKHTVPEPAQSKCTWTLCRSYFVWKFPRKMPDPNPPHPFRASLRFRKALCIEIWRKNAVRQSPGKLFLRAFAVELHMDISPELLCVDANQFQKHSCGSSHEIM